MSVNVLGRTGVVIPSAFLGCGTFGGIGGATELIGRGLDEDAAFAAMDDAVALGIDVFDTAERYAAGASERTIGDWLRQRPAELTAKVRLATKVAPPLSGRHADSQFDRPYIETKLRTSLDRLGVGDVTFYLSHATDDSTPIESTLEGFEAVRDVGLVGHIGCCNVDAGQLRAALAAAERRQLYMRPVRPSAAESADCTIREHHGERGTADTGGLSVADASETVNQANPRTADR